MKIPWKRVVQAIILLLALGFLVALIVRQWHSLQVYEWELSPSWALLALSGLGAAWLMQLGLWRAILGSLGGTLRYWQAARIWFLSNITRYIPGNVWQYLSMVELAAEQGVSRTASLTSVLLHQAISVSAGLALAGLYFACAGEGVWLDRLRPFLYVLPLGLLLLQPRLLERVLNWLLARFKRPPLRVTLTWPQVWALVAAYAVAWIIMGAGFASLVRALTPVTWAQVPALVAIFAAAYVIGFLSLLTPSGLGVREGIMTLLLAAILPAGVSAVIAVVARLWMIVGELIGVAVSLVRGKSPFSRSSGRRLAASQARANPTEPRTSVRSPSVRRLPATLRQLSITRLVRHLPQLLLAAMILAYTVGFSRMSIRLHQAHLTHKSDLGQMDLAIWNTSRGRFVQEVKDDIVSTRLTDHVEPIFLPISLVFWLWNDVRALLVVQSFALAIGALPVFWLARCRFRRRLSWPHSSETISLMATDEDPQRRSSSEWFGLLFAFVYLMFPALQAANLTEFHAIPLAVPFILFAFWFAERERWGGFAAACILLASVKEEAALLAFALGLYAIIQPLVLRSGSDIPDRRSSFRPRSAPLIVGVLVALLGLSWFVVATFIIIPRYASQVYGSAASVYFQRYGQLGNSAVDILCSFVTQPAVVWRTVMEPLRLRYLFGLLASVAFLPLLAPDFLLLATPLLLANLLSSYAAQYSGEFHYSAPLVPYFVVAAIVGGTRLLGWLRRRQVRSVAHKRPGMVPLCILTAWTLAWSLSWQVHEGYTPLGSEFRWPEVTPHHRLLDRFTAQIPDLVPGSATPSLYPHLGHREKLYEFPHVADAQWILLDVSGTSDMHPIQLRDHVQQMLSSGQWGVIDGAGGYLLLGLGMGEQRLPDEFFDFARSEGGQPENSVDLVYRAPSVESSVQSVRLLGYDIVDDDNWRLTRVRTYWQALGDLPADLRVVPFIMAEDGSIVEDTALRPPVAPLWYPAQRWSSGETVIVETLPWFLPPRFGLGIGVTRGDTWDELELRWELSKPPISGAYDTGTWALLGVFERDGERLRRVEEPTLEALAIGTPDVPLSADFGGEISLLGYSGVPETIAAGRDLRLELHWQAQRPLSLNYTLFVHLRDLDGNTRAQHDSQPTWYGEYPTTGWIPGQPMHSAHTLQLDDELPAGDYRLAIGIYNWETMDRLTLIGDNGSPVGNEIELGTVRVVAKQKDPPPRDLCCALVPECCVSQQQN